MEYLAALRTEAWPVRPEAVADLQGSWTMVVVSGTCRSAPPLDWHVEAEAFATSLQGRLRSAQYHPMSKTMTIEFIWPHSARQAPPSARELRAKAGERFRWAS